jgi:hypothetical protein
LCRAAKTFVLRKAIAKRLEEEKKRTKKEAAEGVEIYLYYETLLEDILLTAIKTTKYATGMGKRDWINEGELRKEIEENYLDELAKLEAFQKLFEEDPEIQQQLEKKRGKLQDELEESAEGKGGQHVEAGKNLMHELETYKAQLVREWVKAKLKISSESLGSSQFVLQ